MGSRVVLNTSSTIEHNTEKREACTELPLLNSIPSNKSIQNTGAGAMCLAQVWIHFTEKRCHPGQGKHQISSGNLSRLQPRKPAHSSGKILMPNVCTLPTSPPVLGCSQQPATMQLPNFLISQRHSTYCPTPTLTSPNSRD